MLPLQPHRTLYCSLRRISQNVSGLHSAIKRSKSIAKMKIEKIQIVFWQETHLSDEDHEKLKKMWFRFFYIFTTD